MLHSISLSLADLLGESYVQAVCRARAALTGQAVSALLTLAYEKVDFYPQSLADAQEELMQRVGTAVVSEFKEDMPGAPSASYAAAQNDEAAPLSALGAFRVGQDGRLYFTGKSEHYQASLGHDFPGYRLIEIAKQLGIPNATHNNTRGYITRLLERRLIAAANGLSADDPALDEVLAKREPGVINAVINLETGSLAVEAALKMMLARFYALGNSQAPFAGRIPVFLVMADNAGGPTGNYHGTTVIAQTLRGLWPSFTQAAERAGLYRVQPVPINDAAALERILRQNNEPPYKTAGFCHEIVLMNYGGIRLSPQYLQEAYRLCRAWDTPILCDEIQSCAWYDGLFLFRQYGLKPDFVTIGKGFPGGVYPASRTLLSAAFDNLNQFGALVTNGQEELASLAYLITMAFISANGAHIHDVAQYYHQCAKDLCARYPGLLSGVEGDGHMTSLCFLRVEDAARFCARMNHHCCVDISAQTYKPNCPPVALAKLPLILTRSMVDRLLLFMDECLAATQKGEENA